MWKVATPGSPADSPEMGWRRSSACDSNACVEASAGSRTVMLRDSTRPFGGVLVVAPDVWRQLLAGIRRGRWDR
jgi:hypothetical protein